MEFKENIRFLRRQMGLTQEELAEQLNVSFQTVSKWENGIYMPEIGMLPILADLFKISIDELLGYCSEQRSGKAAKIAREAHSLSDKGCLLEACQYLESETKHFKMDVSLQSLMGFLAYQYAKTATGEEKAAFLNRAIKQADLVMKLDQNAGSRTAQAKLLKCYCLRELGNRKMALEMADKLPSMFSSREVALMRCAEGSEKRQYAQALQNYLQELQEEIRDFI